jgi:hypothetical protein
MDAWSASVLRAIWGIDRNSLAAAGRSPEFVQAYLEGVAAGSACCCSVRASLIEAALGAS